jgi:hypothetical protein
MNYFIKLGRELGHAYMSFFDSLDKGSERIEIDLGFYGVDNLKDSWTQKERFGYEVYLLAKDGVMHINLLSKIIDIVMTQYFSLLPNKATKSLLKSAGMLSAHVAGRTVAAKVMTRIFLKKILYNYTKIPNVDKIVKVADNVIYVFLLEALLDESAKGANYLQVHLPRLYRKLYSENLESLFFIVQKPLEQYLKLIELCYTDHQRFETQACKMYEKL